MPSSVYRAITLFKIPTQRHLSYASNFLLSLQMIKENILFGKLKMLVFLFV